MQRPDRFALRSRVTRDRTPPHMTNTLIAAIMAVASLGLAAQRPFDSRLAAVTHRIDALAQGRPAVATVVIRVRPCAGATGSPTLWASDNPLFDLRARPQRAEENGEFRLRPPARPPLYVLSMAAGCAADARMVSTDSVVIELSTGRDAAFQIRDGDGPVAGSIERKVGPHAVVVTHADDGGQGVLTGLGLGAEDVTGRFQQVSASMSIAPTMGSIVLTVPASGVISGRVIDENGRPIPAASLSLIRNQAQSFVVSETGTFRAEQLAGGTYTLEAAADGFRFQSIEVTLEKRQRANVAIRMALGAQVTVLLVTPTGEPVPKPRLEVESNSAMGFELIDLIRPRRAYTGSPDGRVNIRGLPIGVTQLVLNTPPFARLRLPPLDIGEFTPDIDLGTIAVGTGATLEATVRDGSGKARAGVSVRLDRGPGVSSADPDVVETDAEGHASIGRLGPGRYRVRVGGDDRPGGTGPFAEEWFRVSEGDTRLERTFTAGGVTLDVTVATQAGPLQAARVTVMPGLGDAPEIEGFVVQTKTRLINAPFNPGIRSVTNEAGQATLSDVPPGPARLMIALPGSTWSMPITVGVTDSHTNLLVPPAIAELFVRDAVSGEAVPARATWKAQGSDIRIVASANQTGSAILEGLIEGPASLELESRNHVRLQLELSGLSAMPTEVLMDRTDQTNLTVQVLTAEGRPVTGASAELVQVTAKRWKRVAVSRDDGTLRFSVIEPAAGRLIVRHPSFATSSVDVAAKGPNTIGVVLRPGYRTLLRLREDANPPQTPTRVEVSLLRQQGSKFQDASEDIYPRIATAGAEIELGLLTAGSYRAVLTGPTRTLRCDFVVKDSATLVPCPE